MKPYLGKNLRRSKTDPLPAINATKINLPGGSTAKLRLSRTVPLSPQDDETKVNAWCRVISAHALVFCCLQVLGDSPQPCVDQQAGNLTATTS